MLKQELVNIIRKYPFKSFHQYTLGQIHAYVNKTREKINDDDIVGVYTRSSLFKSEFIIVTIEGLYFSNGDKVIFNELKEVELLNNHIYLKTKRRQTQRLHVDSKDVDMVYDILVSVFALMETTETKHKEVTTNNVEEKKEVDNKNKEAYAQEQFDKGEAFYKEQDYERAFVCYKEAADHGHVRAKTYLGFCYQYGKGVDKDILKAKQCYEEAIQYDFDLGYFRLGEYYYYTEKNYELAAKYYKMAADRNHPRGTYYYALALKEGEGVEKNINEAAKYLKKAADLGIDKAMVTYALCLQKGEGVDKNVSEAIQYFEKAADKGYSYGSFNLGLAYYRGEDVQKDMDKAIKYFIDAANKGHGYSCHILFDFYFHGKEVKQDLDYALKWAKKGVDLGCDDSLYDLGAIYAYRNERTDYALELLLRAAKRDNLSAKIALVVYTANNTLKPDLNTMKEILELTKNLKHKLLEEPTAIIEKYISDIESEKDETELAKIIDELIYAKDTQSQRKLVDLVIRHKYIPDKDFMDCLDFVFMDLLDKDYEFAYQSQQQIYDIYKELVIQRTESIMNDVKVMQQQNNHTEAMKLLEKAYDLDRTEAAYLLGDYYYEGKYVTKDYNKAVKWYEEANTREGNIKIAEIYIITGNIGKGKQKLKNLSNVSYEAEEKLIQYVVDGVIKDTDDIIDIIRKALKNDKYTDQHKKKLQAIIDHYEIVHEEELLMKKGDSLKAAKKYEDAIDYYSKAAKKYKNIRAMLSLVYIYEDILHDQKQYEQWLFMAANADDARSCYYLAHIYKDRKDNKNYDKWLNKAANLGHIKATKERREKSNKANEVYIARQTSKCRHCGACIDACPMLCIEKINGRVSFDENACIGCGICLDACKHKAIILVKLK